MQNKKGGALLTTGIILGILVIIGLLIYVIMGAQQTQFGPTTTITSCALDPTLSINVVNALSKGTSVTPDAWHARVNGVYKGTVTSSTKFSRGDKVEILLNKSSYIDTILDEITIDCGVNNVNAEMYATSAPTITIKNDADTATLTDSASGGLQNESSVSSGGSKTWKVQLTGTDDESTGSMIYVVEIGTPVNVSELTLTDSDGNKLEQLSSVPDGLTISGTNQERVAFRIPEIQNAVRKDFYLTLSAASGKTVSGGVYTTLYGEQAFVDTDGTFKVGVSDSDGTTKYSWTADYDFFIEA